MLFTATSLIVQPGALLTSGQTGDEITETSVSCPAPPRSTMRPVKPVPAAPATRWLCRIVLTVFSIAATTQPLTIGFFLDGHFPALQYHRLMGMALLAMAVVATVIVGVARLRRVYPTAMVWLSAGVVLLLVGQIITGFMRHISGHLLPGVMIIAATWWMAVYAWRH